MCAGAYNRRAAQGRRVAEFDQPQEPGSGVGACFGSEVSTVGPWPIWPA
jgi:hypothetical protein